MQKGAVLASLAGRSGIYAMWLRFQERGISCLIESLILVEEHNASGPCGSRPYIPLTGELRRTLGVLHLVCLLCGLLCCVCQAFYGSFECSPDPSAAAGHLPLDRAESLS